MGKKTCENCFKDLDRAFTCGSCKKVTYCSQKCADENWCLHKPSCIQGKKRSSRGKVGKIGAEADTAVRDRSNLRDLINFDNLLEDTGPKKPQDETGDVKKFNGRSDLKVGLVEFTERANEIGDVEVLLDESRKEAISTFKQVFIDNGKEEEVADNYIRSITKFTTELVENGIFANREKTSPGDIREAIFKYLRKVNFTQSIIVEYALGRDVENFDEEQGDAVVEMIVDDIIEKMEKEEDSYSKSLMLESATKNVFIGEEEGVPGGRVRVKVKGVGEQSQDSMENVKGISVKELPEHLGKMYRAAKKSSGQRGGKKIEEELGVTIRVVDSEESILEVEHKGKFYNAMKEKQAFVSLAVLEDARKELYQEDLRKSRESQEFAQETRGSFSDSHHLPSRVILRAESKVKKKDAGTRSRVYRYLLSAAIAGLGVAAAYVARSKIFSHEKTIDRILDSGDRGIIQASARDAHNLSTNMSFRASDLINQPEVRDRLDTIGTLYDSSQVVKAQDAVVKLFNFINSMGNPKGVLDSLASSSEDLQRKIAEAGSDKKVQNMMAKWWEMVINKHSDLAQYIENEFKGKDALYAEKVLSESLILQHIRNDLKKKLGLESLDGFGEKVPIDYVGFDTVRKNMEESPISTALSDWLAQDYIGNIKMTKSAIGFISSLGLDVLKKTEEMYASWRTPIFDVLSRYNFMGILGSLSKAFINWGISYFLFGMSNVLTALGLSGGSYVLEATLKAGETFSLVLARLYGIDPESKQGIQIKEIFGGMIGSVRTSTTYALDAMAMFSRASLIIELATAVVSGLVSLMGFSVYVSTTALGVTVAGTFAVVIGYMYYYRGVNLARYVADYMMRHPWMTTAGALTVSAALQLVYWNYGIKGFSIYSKSMNFLNTQITDQAQFADLRLLETRRKVILQELNRVSATGKVYAGIPIDHAKSTMSNLAEYKLPEVIGAEKSREALNAVKDIANMRTSERDTQIVLWMKEYMGDLYADPETRDMMKRMYANLDKYYEYGQKMGIIE